MVESLLEVGIKDGSYGIEDVGSVGYESGFVFGGVGFGSFFVVIIGVLLIERFFFEDFNGESGNFVEVCRVLVVVFDSYRVVNL